MLLFLFIGTIFWICNVKEEGPIKLFEYIASGAWGVVYKAKLLENDDKDNYFAVKIQINNREMQKELFILNKLKKYNNTEFKNPHLPLIFDEIKCNNIDYSDERIKKNIQDIDDDMALQKILQIEPKNRFWETKVRE